MEEEIRMRAVVHEKYGSPDVLELKEVQKPVPDDDQVLIKVRAASLNASNLFLLKGDPFLVRFAFGLRKPKFIIAGSDIAGTVEAVGKNIKQFQPGDEVFGDLSECGWSGFAQYAVATEQAIALKPSKLSFEEAAAVPMAGATALQALRDKGKVQSGQKVLINGASGGVGTFAAQIAKAFGAEVTAVVSTRNVEIAESLGVDHVIDYTKENVTEKEEKYDVIISVNGINPLSAYNRILNQNGILVLVGGSTSQLLLLMMVGPWMSMTGNKKMHSFMQKPKQEDLVFLKELFEARKIKSVIDRTYTLDEAPEAFRYLAEGHAKGKVVITV
jgi:NADPH:quinone reductase-like Zn-dependent oxidoreductase